MTHYRLNPAALFCLALAILGLVLAHWQWSRAQFKEQQIERAAPRGSLDSAASMPTALGGPGFSWSKDRSADSLDQKTYRLQGGEWITGTQLFLDNRALNGRAGVHVLTAARLNDGSIAWVNRGWAPKTPGTQGPTAEPFIQASVHPPNQTTLDKGFEVVAHKSLMRRVELSENDAVLRQGALWQNFDARAASELLERLLPNEAVQLWPVIFWAAASLEDGLVQQPPRIAQDDVAKHYGYAFQWVLLTLVALFFAWKLGRKSSAAEA
ncbi:MAG: SURF1 family protein [Bordetella sp.]